MHRRQLCGQFVILVGLVCLPGNTMSKPLETETPGDCERTEFKPDLDNQTSLANQDPGYDSSTPNYPYVDPSSSLARILSGDKTSYKKYWMVYIDTGDPLHPCVGSLIHPHWVITSGRCLPKVGKIVTYVYAFHFFARATTYSKDYFLLPDIPEKESGGILMIKRIPPPTEASYITSNPIKVNLEYDNLFTLHEMCYAFGWTSNGLHDVFRDRFIRKIKVKIAYFMWDTIVCRVHPEHQGPEGLCNGELGTGLVCKINGGEYLVGVADAFNKTSCNQRYSDLVFVNTYPYRYYINTTMTDPRQMEDITNCVHETKHY